MHTLSARRSNCHVHKHQGRLSVSRITCSSCNAGSRLDGMPVDSGRRTPLSNGRVERSSSHSPRTYKPFSCDLPSSARGLSEMVSRSTECSPPGRSSTRSLITESKSEYSLLIGIADVDPTSAPLRVSCPPVMLRYPLASNPAVSDLATVSLSVPFPSQNLDVFVHRRP